MPKIFTKTTKVVPLTKSLKTTNPQLDIPFEKQRDEFLPAAKQMAIAAFAIMGKDVDLDYGQRIVSEYERMYSPLADNEDPKSQIIRFYHVLSHPLVQMLSDEALDLLMAVHRGEKSLDGVVLTLEQNPHLAHEIRNKLRHDAVQDNGTGWQARVIKELKNGEISFADLLQRDDLPEHFQKAGFTPNPQMRKFIKIAAKQFYPNGKEKFALFGDKGSEFVSAVYSYYLESSQGKDLTKPNLAEQIEIILFLRGTIPFKDVDEFNKMPDEFLSSLTKAEKDELLAIIVQDPNFVKECNKYNITKPDYVKYWIHKRTNEACRGANLDVANFAKGPDDLYHGDNSVRSEFANLGLHIMELPAVDRIKQITIMIGEHCAKQIGKVGFSVIEKARNGTIYHGFDSEFDHLRVMQNGELRDFHEKYMQNCEVTLAMHRANLIQAAVEVAFGDNKTFKVEKLNSKSLEKIADNIIGVFVKLETEQKPDQSSGELKNLLKKTKLGIQEKKSNNIHAAIKWYNNYHEKPRTSVRKKAWMRVSDIKKMFRAFETSGSSRG